MFNSTNGGFLILRGLGDGFIKLQTQGLGVRKFNKPSTQISQGLIQCPFMLSDFQKYTDPISDLLHGQSL